ncbi:protein of unknown function [Catalinimonas alkaloidigena]|uniref:DUF4856 domain-containing protein n=2 Tax=Catalinimonas alkaloidigena TaxID=1075417 RepID=A0A1G9JI30_9BACT|nr:protein of unknown function [Catalinimonas alkaloidigena]
MALTLSACQQDDPGPSRQLPETYAFENVNYAGQTTRLDMLNEIVTYAKTSNLGLHVEADVLLNMYANQDYTWQQADLNEATKKIADKLDATGATQLTQWIQELDELSQNPGEGDAQTAGLVRSQDGSKEYLLTAEGFELAQLLEKGTMGALAYYQATAVYLSESKMNVDNTTVEPGEGTAMQHHWDEAFGYWGVPQAFGSADFVYDNTADYHRFWAKYTHALDEALGVDATLMQAFIKGRDAIDRADYATRDEAIAEVRNTWELVVAGMAIHYLKGAEENFGDQALRNHQLSEAYGFIWSLQFNPTHRISDHALQQLLETNLSNLNTLTVADLTAAKQQLADVYGLEDKLAVL